MRERGQAFLFIQEYQLSSELPVVFGRACWICLWILSLCTEDFPLARKDAARIRGKEALWTGGTVIKFWQRGEKSREEYI